MAASPFLRREEPSPIADVNVVPLADVSLVLLIILLVLSPMASQSALRVLAAGGAPAPASPGREAPEAAEPAAIELPLAVALTGAGALVEGRLVPDEELAGAVAGLLAARRDRKVYLAPEPEVSHGRVVSAVLALSGAGASAVALVRAPEA